MSDHKSSKKRILVSLAGKIFCWDWGREGGRKEHNGSIEEMGEKVKLKLSLRDLGLEMVCRSSLTVPAGTCRWCHQNLHGGRKCLHSKSVVTVKICILYSKELPSLRYERISLIILWSQTTAMNGG